MEINGHQIIVLLLTLLGGGVGVSIVAQGLKKLFKLNVNSVIRTMVAAASAVAAGAQYAVTLKSKVPPEILGVTATTIYGASQLVFQYSKDFSGFMAKVQAFDAAQKPAAASTTAVETPVVHPELDV